MLLANVNFIKSTDINSNNAIKHSVRLQNIYSLICLKTNITRESNNAV